MDIQEIGRIYKGEEYTISFSLPFSGSVDNFELYFFTDSANTVSVPYSALTIDSANTAEMQFTDTAFDALNDGVLKYYLKWTVGTVDKIQSTNTMHYLKTPYGYNPQTTQDIYNEGYEAGVEAAGGDYSDGYADGEAAQKAKLETVSVTENGTYEREDGYSMVTVNVPQTGGTYTSQSKDFNITQNGNTTITVDQGYDGITGGTINVNVPTQNSPKMAQFPNYFGCWYDANSFLSETGQVLSIKFKILRENTSYRIYDSTDNEGYGGISIAYSSYHNITRIVCDFDDEASIYFPLSSVTFPYEAVITLVYKKGEYVIGKLTTDDGEETIAATHGIDAFSFTTSGGFCLNNERDDYTMSTSGLVIDYLRLYDIDSNGDKTMTHNFEFDGTNFVDLLSNNIATTNYLIERVDGELVRRVTSTVPTSVDRTFINDNLYLTQTKDFNITATTSTTENITIDAPYEGITGGSINVTVTQTPQVYGNYNAYIEGSPGINLRMSSVLCKYSVYYFSGSTTQRMFYCFYDCENDSPYDRLDNNSSTFLSINVSDASGMTYFQPPACVVSVEDGCMSGFTSLTMIDSRLFMFIGNNAFDGCSSMTSFVFGRDIQEIGDYAFRNCSSMTKIFIYSTQPPTFGTGVFANLPSNGVLAYDEGCDYNSWLAILPNGWTAEQYSNTL